MPRKKKEVKKVQTESKTEPKIKTESENIQEPKVQTEFRVLDRNLKFVRAYSVKVHGKDAKKLAYEFATKIQGWVN